MNKGLLPGGVLVAVFTIAVATMIGRPTAVLAQTAERQSTQAAPDQQDTHGERGMMHGMGMGDDMDMPMRGMHGMMGGQGMGPMARMHQMMMRASPRERCDERLAHRAAMIAYTLTKLNLTAEQKPLWDKLNGIIQAATDRGRQLCASLPAPTSAGRRRSSTG